MVWSAGCRARAGAWLSPCHFGHGLTSPEAAGIFASSDLGLLAKDNYNLSSRPGLARRGPFTPSPSVWKKGPRLPSRLPQEMWSLEVRGQTAAPPVGAKQPNAGASITPAPAAGDQGREVELWKGERGKARLFLFM